MWFGVCRGGDTFDLEKIRWLGNGDCNCAVELKTRCPGEGLRNSEAGNLCHACIAVGGVTPRTSSNLCRYLNKTTTEKGRTHKVSRVV